MSVAAYTAMPKNNRTGSLCATVGDLVSVNKEKAKIIVTADMAFSKRYLKYLAKKYLKKHSVRTSSFCAHASCRNHEQHQLSGCMIAW